LSSFLTNLWYRLNRIPQAKTIATFTPGCPTHQGSSCPPSLPPLSPPICTARVKTKAPGILLQAIGILLIQWKDKIRNQIETLPEDTLSLKQFQIPLTWKMFLNGLYTYIQAQCIEWEEAWIKMIQLLNF
jgi:hypothetical protein